MPKDAAYARTLIWESLLESDYLTRYYAYLARRLTRIEQALTAAVIVLSSGAVAALLRFEEYTLLSPALSFVTALLGVYLFSSRPGRIALLCSWQAHRWRALLLDYELLWCKVDELGADKLISRWTRLQQIGNAGTEAAPVEFPMVPRLMRKAQDEVTRDRLTEEGRQNNRFRTWAWRWLGWRIFEQNQSESERG